LCANSCAFVFATLLKALQNCKKQGKKRTQKQRKTAPLQAKRLRKDCFVFGGDEGS
jgi:hypothetical protein